VSIAVLIALGNWDWKHQKNREAGSSKLNAEREKAGGEEDNHEDTKVRKREKQLSHTEHTEYTEKNNQNDLFGK
jgi:hypothetical protein